MNASDGPSEARRAKDGASADSADGMKDTTGVNPWRLHLPIAVSVPAKCFRDGLERKSVV